MMTDYINSLKDKINLAIAKAEKADARNSELFPIEEIKILSGEGIRVLLNELAKLSSYYLEAGVFCGGSFMAAIYKNPHLKGVCAIDHWNEGASYRIGRQYFNSHVRKYLPEVVPLTVIDQDHWKVDKLPFKPDLYYYDGAHDAASQEKALTHFGKMCADTFIYCVDDWNNQPVQEGTRKGLKNFDVLYEWTKETPFTARTLTNVYQSNFWNGFGVWILKQKA